MVYIILAEGFEEIEAIAPSDILRRGNVETKLCGVGSDEVSGGHGIKVKTDCTVEETDFSDAEMIVFPGGTLGVENIGKCEKAMAAMKKACSDGRRTAAICAGSTLLAKLKITDGRKAVCYPGLESEMGGAVICRQAGAVTDGNVTTGKAAGTSIQFALELLRVLRGEEAAETVKKSIHF